MRFEEWYEKYGGYAFISKDIAMELYQAGQADQREKDARIAESLAINAFDSDEWDVACENVAKAIREAE